MPYYYDRAPNREAPVPHGPSCDCDVCRGQRVMNTERLSSSDRLAWLEKQIITLKEELSEIKKGNNSMGHALWCQTGAHSFDEYDSDAERMTVDERDPATGKKTGREKTVHVCGRHAADMLAPKPKSLKEIEQDIREAEFIGE